MADLIRRENALSELESVGITKNMRGYRKVASIHSVDAVEVVRCRECKHHYWVQEPCHGKSVHYCKLPHMSGVEVFKEFFCYYGERKEGDGNG